MLVLTRKTNEKIIIDGNIEIVLLQAQAGRVRLGITAPKQVSIQRQEVHERIERALAGCVASGDVADEPLRPVVEIEMPLPLQGPVAL